MPRITSITSQALAGLGFTRWPRLVHILDNPNDYGPSGADLFGTSAISGNYAIVGAEGETAPYLEGIDYGKAGKAYIFNVTTGALVHTLDNPNAFGTKSGDYFGNVVDIDGDYAIVGAYAEDTDSDIESGKAYIFDVTTGALVHTLDNPNVVSGFNDQFGYSVAISGDRAIVGTPNEQSVYIFNVTTGALVHTLNNPSVDPVGDRFGRSVAIDGNYAIVGARDEADAGGTFSGKAYIYNVTTGALVYTLDNPNAYDTSASDFFGTVAISGNYAIVGAGSEDDAGGLNSGKAYIFKTTTGDWTDTTLLHTLDNPNAYGTSEGDGFGGSVDIDGDYAIVGAGSEDDASGSPSGKAYIFNVTTGALVYTLNNPNPYGTSAYDSFARSVSISGARVIVGAGSEDALAAAGSGKAYVYKLPNQILSGTLVYTLDNPNPFSVTASDFYGGIVAIDSDLAIVSSTLEDDDGTGTFATYNGISGLSGGNGQRSGKAYAYNTISGQLVHTFDNPNIRSTTSGDNFGSGIIVTPDYIIISATNEAFTQPGASGAVGNGAVYTFDRATFSLLRTLVNPNVYGPATGSQDLFGRSIAVTQNFLFISSRERSTGAVANQIGSGVVYVYDVTDGIEITAPDAVIDNPDPGGGTPGGDEFGRAMAADGNLLVVSAPGEDDADPAGPFVTSRARGKVYVFNATTRQLLLTLDNPNTTNPDFDGFGTSVDIVGNRIAVGAWQNDEENQGVRTGKVYIFNATAGALLLTLNNPNENILYFGVSVALIGNRVLVGAGNLQFSSSPTIGAVYVFDLTTGELLTTLSSNIVGDRFGRSIDVSGNNVIIGAEGDNADLGKAYIYNLSSF